MNLPCLESYKPKREDVYLNALKLQYVTDETGEKKAVILQIEEFNDLTEEMIL